MRPADRSLVVYVRDAEEIEERINLLALSGRIAARRHRVQRTMGAQHDARGEREVALSLVAIAGRERNLAQTRGDMNLRDGMKIVLGDERKVILLEVAGSNLPSYVRQADSAVPSL